MPNLKHQQDKIKDFRRHQAGSRSPSLEKRWRRPWCKWAEEEGWLCAGGTLKLLEHLQLQVLLAELRLTIRMNLNSSLPPLFHFKVYFLEFSFVIIKEEFNKRHLSAPLCSLVDCHSQSWWSAAHRGNQESDCVVWAQIKSSWNWWKLRMRDDKFTIKSCQPFVLREIKQLLLTSPWGFAGGSINSKNLL